MLIEPKIAKNKQHDDDDTNESEEVHATLLFLFWERARCAPNLSHADQALSSLRGVGAPSDHRVSARPSLPEAWATAPRGLVPLSASLTFSAASFPSPTT